MATAVFPYLPADDLLKAEDESTVRPSCLILLLISSYEPFYLFNPLTLPRPANYPGTSIVYNPNSQNSKPDSKTATPNSPQ
jgi:hypothetical protein